MKVWIWHDYEAGWTIETEHPSWEGTTEVELTEIEYLGWQELQKGIEDWNRKLWSLHKVVKDEATRGRIRLASKAPFS